MDVVEKAKQIAKKHGCKLKIIPQGLGERIIIENPNGLELKTYFILKLEDLGNLGLKIIEDLCKCAKNRQ